VLRPLSLLPALVAVVATSVPAATAHPAGPADPGDAVEHRTAPVSRGAARAPASAPDDSALGVTIDSLTPSVLPRRGPVRISGSVTNRTGETWRAVNLHAFVGDAPITSGAALAEQAEVAPEEFVGERITVPGTFDTVDELAPGASAQYSMDVPRSVIEVTQPGVYWFGVHALGESDEPRDGVADGRARTFMPLVAGSARPVDTALVIPLRKRISHQADGRVAGARRWAQNLESGPLHTLVELGASAGSRPVTWLVDPALPDAVRALVAGNPPRSLEDTVGDDDQPGEGEPPGDEQTGSDPSASPTPEEADPPTTEPDEELVPSEATEPGTAWLNRVREATEGDLVLRLPYGDVDVTAALRHDPAVYRDARASRGRELTSWQARTAPAVAPLDGYLRPTDFARLADAATVLVADATFGADPRAVATVSGHGVVGVSTGAASGGPGPDDRLGAIAVRQRILSEAALRLGAADPEPLVVVLPHSWNPDSIHGFFEGLDVPWLDLTGLRTVARRPAEPVAPEDLAYPPRQARLVLDGVNFGAARALTQAGETLQNVLLRNDRVAREVREEALAALSYTHRNSEDLARARTARSRAWILDQLGSVTVQAPRAVTLSSSSGRFSATVSNALEHPVTVRIRALADRPIQIEGPSEIEIAAESRTSVLLQASTERLGVHNVQLVVTDVDGTPLGSTDTLPIRSAQVSRVIWVILGTGVALLFGAIVVRLVRRVRGAAR
jgi:hypothetical protein